MGLFDSLKKWIASSATPRAHRFNEIMNEPERAPLVSLVPNADALRDALVFLKLEVEGDTTDGPQITKGGFYARAGMSGVAAGYQGASETAAEKQLRASELQDRFNGVWEAWHSLSPETQRALEERNLDVDFIVHIRETAVPRSAGEYAPLKAEVERALATFCDYDYDYRTEG